MNSWSAGDRNNNQYVVALVIAPSISVSDKNMTDYLEINPKTSLSEISFDDVFSKSDIDKRKTFYYKK